MSSKPYSQIYLDQDYLARYPKQLKLRPQIDARRLQIASILDLPSLKPRYQNQVRLPERQTKHKIYTENAVTIGLPDELSQSETETLYRALRDLMPWRKGPFNYFGIHVDAEWQSHLKWDRVMNYCHLDLSGLKLADIGCNNTYYMRRMLPLNPGLVVGFDPLPRYFFYHLLNQRFAYEEKLAFELLGVDDLALYPNFFDIVFLMGVLYHRRNPIHSLQAAAASLCHGGQIIVENAGIPGDEPVCLFPARRYMKAKGYWFLPTWKTLENMLGRCGFTEIDTFEVFPLTTREQRKTEWAVFEDLSDFLDPKDNAKTVEGYPAPVRIYTRARKK